MRKEQCSNCGAEAQTVRGSYRFKESGLRNVVLHGIEIIRCRKCGNEDPILPRLNNLMRTIALALASKPYRLHGPEVRFLRNYMGMTGERFSALLHVDKTTLSKWENNDDPVGYQSDRLIRLLAISRDRELCEKIGEVVKNFERIRERKRPLRVEVNPETSEYRYA